jgi:hypothetical protein
MKFRTISRLIYLKRAQHRHGHGIHSPFLFRLITTVIEDKRRLPEYKKFREFNSNVLRLLETFSGPEFDKVFRQFEFKVSKPGKLYRKAELPLRYSKVVFRLIRYFNPASIIVHSQALGGNLAVMALANNQIPVYQVIDQPEFMLLCNEFLKDSGLTNIYFLTENSEQPVIHPFTIINYPNHPDISGNIADKCLGRQCEDNVMIIRGIHESKDMEVIWHKIIDSECVRVSLDLFEIGIVLFRKGLQKENFIHRF